MAIRRVPVPVLFAVLRFRRGDSRATCLPREVQSFDLEVGVIAVVLERVGSDQGKAVGATALAAEKGSWSTGDIVELGSHREGVTDQARPQTRVIAASRPCSPRQVPITSSEMSIVQSGLSAATTSVKSAEALKSVGSPPSG